MSPPSTPCLYNWKNGSLWIDRMTPRSGHPSSRPDLAHGVRWHDETAEGAGVSRKTKTCTARSLKKNRGSTTRHPTSMVSSTPVQSAPEETPQGSYLEENHLSTCQNRDLHVHTCTYRTPPPTKGKKVPVTIPGDWIKHR